MIQFWTVSDFSELEGDLIDHVCLLKVSILSSYRRLIVPLLILRQIHQGLEHYGRNHMMAVLRENYWLVHAASAIRKLVSKCTICRRERSSVGEQKMASLPADRLTPDDPPFT